MGSGEQTTDMNPVRRSVKFSGAGVSVGHFITDQGEHLVQLVVPNGGCVLSIPGARLIAKHMGEWADFAEAKQGPMTLAYVVQINQTEQEKDGATETIWKYVHTAAGAKYDPATGQSETDPEPPETPPAPATPAAAAA